ncbi:putative OSM3-like kinesin [Leptomonas pyrrhocoris]|uniref:Kinesin-like protein n=1 Tax=Leptomonas pyrrhocoris TaxID=157538 RepID=A0A0M9FU84_LEPPY|nr:putative OSM3-like kinesin [Leptomonas pyrrhocoris]KPA76195.1 putative OSM3-like kinesin [Leptomonas pyrrhocoris]|eukprot:XP_015654634.1 putative OSM3-like kinesin [Leptomonas pyrrhocoris]
MGKKDSGAAAAENIKVLVRCRPLSEKEKASGHTPCVDLDLAANTVAAKSVIGEPDRFTFDAVINNSFSQKDIFTQFIMPLADSVLKGFNATVFAYGQSGSGKTHTMTGVMGDTEMEGIIPRCVAYIFQSVKKIKEESPSMAVSMYVSFLELYNGKVRDLLAKQQVSLEIHQHKDSSFFVQGAVVAQVKLPEDVMSHLEEGTDRRRVASTELNADSSRSHSIFTLLLECTETLEDGTTRAVSSKLNLVDLAGSERQGKTGASGDTLKEGCNINLSLSALGTVIDTIVKGGSHIPFRSSPLTMLLKDSLGGNSKTVMFANINPSERNLSETVSTLRFADRAKQIKNKPVVNMDSKDQKIAELTDMVKELKEKLSKYETEGTAGMEEELEKLQEKVGDLEVQLDNATKGREADLVDYETVKATLASERQSFSTRLVEVEDEVVQLQNQLQITESNASAVQAQLNDVFALCHSYLLTAEEKTAQPVEQLRTVEALEVVLKAVKKRLGDGGASGMQEQIASLQADLHAAHAEHKATKKELRSTKGQLESQLKEAREALEQARVKLEKAKMGSNNSFSNASASRPVSASVARDYAAQQEKVMAALKMDSTGVAAMQVLRDENEKLRQHLLSAANAVSPTSARGSGINAVASLTNMAAAASFPTPQDMMQLNALQAELEEERTKSAQLTKARDELYAKMDAQGAELAKAETTIAQHDRELTKVKQEYEAKLSATAGSDEEVTRLESRLRERTDQLDQLRQLLEKQKAIIVKNNEKAEYFQASLREKNEALAALDQQCRAQLEQKDTQMQQLINKRVEEFTEQRNAEMDQKMHNQKKLKKKLQKLQEELEDWEAKYDTKMCECADLRNALEEKNVQYLRLMRRIEYADDEVEVIEQKEQFQNALERAKSERKRKDDLFAKGEVKNAKKAAKRCGTAHSEYSE